MVVERPGGLPHGAGSSRGHQPTTAGYIPTNAIPMQPICHNGAAPSTALAVDMKAAGNAIRRTPRRTIAQPTNEMIAAAGFAQEVCSPTTVSPSNSTSAPTSQDHTGSASNSDSSGCICDMSVCISETRTAAVRGQQSERAEDPSERAGSQTTL